MRSRALALVVGRESPRRNELARALIERGRAVVLCPGPPGCVLLREDRCVLVDHADVVIQLVPRAGTEARIAELRLCASQARRCLVANSTGAPGPAAVADAVDTLMPSGTRSIS